MLNRVLTKANEIEQKIVEYRRDFHRYPEVGWTEYRTSSLIARRLKDLGYQVLAGRDVLSDEDRMGLPQERILDSHWQRALAQGGDPEFLELMKGGFTGVVGVLGGGEGRARALRFDIDALPISESGEASHFPVQAGFSSVNDGVMHACGHDFHGAAGLGIAEILADNKDELSGTVKLIFQPAEEGVRGAKSIVSKGILDDVDRVIGFHVQEYGLGQISSGLSGFIATKKFDVFIHGKPAHAGGEPQDGANAMLAAATAVLNLHAIPRHRDGATRVNVGSVTAGSGRNIIPDRAHMIVETRGASSDLSRYMYDKAEKVIEHSCLMYDCGYDIVPMGEALSGESDPELMRLVEEAAEKIGGYDCIDKHESFGSEDFTYMMTKVQENGGKAVNIGIGADMRGDGFHSHNLDLNEGALKKAMVLISMLVLV